MSNFTPINARSYYDYLPTSNHQCGDIWISLPSMGLLSAFDYISGIMITPACDLSNLKAETLTYLPVISISSYLGSTALIPTVRREILDRYNSAKIHLLGEWPEKGYEPPPEHALALESDRLKALLEGTSLPAPDRGHIGRALAGIRILSICRSATESKVDLLDYSVLFGKNWSKMKTEIIKNSYRPDIHFLPADEQNDGSIGINNHSVVLFRYPISVPAEILTSANVVSNHSWSIYMDSCLNMYRSAIHFRNAKPIKILSLKSSFLSDLLSRFTALYGRIGSPDFSDATIDRFAGEIA